MGRERSSVPPAAEGAAPRHGGRRGGAVTASGLALVLLLWTAPTGAQEPAAPGDTCPQGRVSHVFIDNHSIFDVDDLQESGSLGWAYELANTLHIRTRADFIRDEILLEEGDCYDPVLVEESGRILRSYPFIAQADVFAVEQPDGSKHLVVDTQDEWTTQLDLGVSLDDGVNLEVLELTEENFLGRGILLEGFLSQRREEQDVGARLEFPRLFGTRLDARLGAGTTRAGQFVSQLVRYPFVGEVGRLAMRQFYRRRDEIFPFATGARTGLTHLALPVEDDRFELSVAARVGVPGNLTVFGMGVTRTTLDYPGFPGAVEAIRDREFGAGEPAPADLRALLDAQARPLSTTRINFILGQRNLRFARVRGLDALAGEQDVQLGSDIGLTLGRSVDAFTRQGLPTADDIFGRLRLFVGADPGTSYVFLNAAAQARQIVSGEGQEDGWRDVMAEVDLYGYLRSRRLPGQTVFARLSASGGWLMDVPYQLTLGGREALRGWNEDEFPGAQRVVASLEDRILLPWPAPDFMDFGVTFFADAGRVWAGEIPFGVDSGWKASVGGGLRLGFPAGSRGVARLDLAFPVLGGEGRGPIFRVTLLELLGLTTGFFDQEMERSRRVTIGPDSFVQMLR